MKNKNILDSICLIHGTSCMESKRFLNNSKTLSSKSFKRGQRSNVTIFSKKLFSKLKVKLKNEFCKKFSTRGKIFFYLFRHQYCYSYAKKFVGISIGDTRNECLHNLLKNRIKRKAKFNVALISCLNFIEEINEKSKTAVF